MSEAVRVGMTSTGFGLIRPAVLLAIGFIVGALALTSTHNFLLFHILSELMSVVIGCGTFVIAWNIRRQVGNNYLVFLGIALLPVAGLDLAHMLAYKGMPVLGDQGPNAATQLWVASRALQAFALLVAPLTLRRSLHPGLLLAGGIGIVLLILASVFLWKVFPPCYVEGTGLTGFKIVTEYVICAMLLTSMGLLYKHRSSFDPQVLRWLLWAIGFTIASEFVFTIYINVYGPMNVLGHILKILAFFLSYKALIVTGLTKPHALLLRQLSQSEERYRLLFDLSPDPIFSVDISGRFIVANEACHALSGYSPSELLQMNFADLCAPEAAAEAQAAFRRLLQRTGYGEMESTLVRRDGSRVDVWVAGQPLLVEGKLHAVQCTAKDISERRQFQAKLERLVQERTSKLQELVGELEHFSYTITHDMRAPLRAMRAFGGLLQEECAATMSPQAKGYLERILTSSERMDRLIVDALHYSKAVMKELQLRPLDPGPLLQGIVDSYPQLQAPEAEILIETPLLHIVGNEAGLTQCFANLLGNAVKFVRPGTRPRVRIWTEERRGFDVSNAEAVKQGISENDPKISDALMPENCQPVVRIWFEDNGIGVPTKYQPKLFQMFQRLSREYEGTGIGLAIVRKVAERMNGRVGLESEEGRGSRFWLEFLKAP